MAKSKKELRQAVKDKLAAGMSVSDIKKTNVGKKLGGSTVKAIAGRYTPSTPSGGGDTSGGGGGYSGGGGGYSGGGTSGGATSTFDFGSVFQDVIAPFQIDLANIQAGATTQAATIRAEADKEVARAYADAQKYGAELGLEGTKYASDKESEWRQAVANIEVKGKLDLQPIINAGLERVAGIEAQAQRDVAETTGKYSLASTKEQTATQERLGKMELAGSMYGLLGAAFG